MLDDDPEKLIDEYDGGDVDEGEHVVLQGATSEAEREPDEVEL